MLTRPAMRGFTLVELLVGLVVGLLVVGAAGAIYVITVQSKSEALRAAKLNQEVRSLLAAMAPDIRRAGYWGGAVSASAATVLPLTSGASHPFMSSTGNLAIHDEGRCILFSYDADGSGDGVVPATEVFGYRLAPDGEGVEALAPGSRASTGGDCTTGEWSRATSGGTAAVDTLEFSTVGSHCVNATRAVTWTVTAPGFRASPCAAQAAEVTVTSGTYAAPAALDLLTEVRQVTISIRARHRADARLALAVDEALRLPNNRVRRY